MKYHISIKFLVVLLCALSLLCSLGAIAGIAVMEHQDLYEEDFQQLLRESKEQTLQRIAQDIAMRYASDYLGGCDQTVIQQYYGQTVYSYYLHRDKIGWDILDESGHLLYASHRSGITWNSLTLPVTGGSYLRMVSSEPAEDSATIPAEPGKELPTAPTVSPADKNQDAYFFQDPETGEYRAYELIHEPMPQWTVVLYLQPTAWKDAAVYEGLLLLWQNRYALFWILGAGLLLFAVSAVYLCCAAGRKPGSEEIRAAGFNALPLDLYLAGAAGILMLDAMIFDELIHWFSLSYTGMFFVIVCAGFVPCLLFVAFCFACAAQFKEGGGRWWRKSVIGFTSITAVELLWKAITVWTPAAAIWSWNTAKTVVRFLWKIVTVIWEAFSGAALWVWRKITGGFWWVGAKLERVYTLLPVTWQWLLAGIAMVTILLLGFQSARDYYNSGSGLLLCIGICLVMVLYGAHAFGILLEGAKRMSRGDLDAKVSDRLLLGAFREFAQDLNALADVTKEAAQKEMRSERMKTELITNVSHDIKTPLTSIINYVDLLQKPHTPEEEAQYLEVLGRKSQQLKKLIQDLMEMSKASTGNMAVHPEQMDAVETVTQALGEFSDKLAQSRLTPVFTPPAEKLLMRADGRLAWRVLNNLLGNAVKYALPGTRLYVTLEKRQGQVLISLKNVSAEPLNMDTGELMERFVRGDASRNSEGSGLGLNIAKSLMEVQGGTLTVTVDGDLFKATVAFPAS